MHQDLLSIDSLAGGKRNATTSSLADNWFITANGIGISRQQYLHDVSYLASQLPNSSRFALNLCKERYQFLVALHAVALKSQTSLLPPNQAPGIQRELLQQHKDCYVVCDESLPPHPDALIFQMGLLGMEKNVEALHPGIDIASNHLAAILFTSGTSGNPTAIHKTWGELQAGVRLTAEHFGLTGQRDRYLVATVPPKHMFGLEISIMLPLTCGTGFINNRPFFPEDIRQTLSIAPGRTILVIPPSHLKACVDSGLDWLECGCDLVLCATAPLTRKLAASVEERIDAQVREIYGSTETGAVATQCTVVGDEWHFYPGITAQSQNDGFLVSGGHLVTPCQLNDHLQIQASGRFKLLEHHSDMIKLAVKRASISELNQKLNQIGGVVDGAFFDTAEPGQGNQTTRSCRGRPRYGAPRTTGSAGRVDRPSLSPPPTAVRRCPATKRNRQTAATGATLAFGVMSNCVELRVVASHPCLQGHFPGNPVVPGVVILDLVAEHILARYSDGRIGGFPQVKFLSPLFPETRFQLTWTERPDKQIDFYCGIGNRRLAQGRIQMEATG